MPHPYTVINASAGSGKTYALVQRLLIICLRYPNQPDAIRHILALTFTNKAANEMKERILSWLKNFASEQYADNQDLQNIKKKLEEENIRVSLQDLHVRARKTLDYILHHYSTLNIGTIDKFNARLVRSFSYELGLAQNFNLEIESEPYLIEAVDQVLDEIGAQQEVSDAFMDFVNYSLDNNERTSLNQTLYQSAKEFVQDKHYFQLSENRDFSWQEYEKSKEKLRREIRTLKEQNLDLAEKTLHFLAERDLDIADFAGGKSSSLAKFFAETKKFYQKERAGFPLPTTSEESAQNTFLKGASGTGKKRESEILEILDDLLQRRSQIIQNYISTRKKEKILQAILPLKVNKEIQDKLAGIEEENDLVLLSKFNILIHENLRQEPSAFIYEKVGTQFYHYFFDEFQDTSQLQWQNFLPLRDHTIHSDNTSFTVVGDPKQSIYRFRGGDSQMMLDIIQHREKNVMKANVEVLDTNWRSARNIVDFNNRLYDFLSQDLREEHRSIFGAGSQQKAQAAFPGRVRIHLMEKAKKQDFYREVAEKMQQDIQQCLDHGFRLADITILCRGNFEIFSYSQILGGMKIQQNGTETYIKTISDKGLTLELSPTILATIEYLRWEQNPKNHQFMVKMMYYLQEAGRISVNDFSLEMLEILEQPSRFGMIQWIAEHYGLSLLQTDIPHLNLYNYIEYYLQEFSVSGKETDFLLNFLEMLYNFSQNAGFTLKDFLKYWDEEAHKINIQTSENIDAVQIMTIHKAKGLEFPVVFLPMTNDHKDGRFSGWIAAEETSVHSVIVSPFEKTLENYDGQMQTFNQENIYLNRTDRYCLQYVATTRAVEQMYFYLEKPAKTNQLELFSFAETLRAEKFQNQQEQPDSFDVYDVNPEILQKQKTKKENEESRTENQSIDSIGHQQKSANAIKIATPSRNYQEKNEKVRRGIFVHEVLEKIATAEDVPSVLKSYLLEGLITRQEQEEISERILEVILDARYAYYFSDQVAVMQEKEVMICENNECQVYRPDRIVENEKGCIIIDFKTGSEREKYERQVETYKNILEKTGKKVLATEIIYL